MWSRFLLISAQLIRGWSYAYLRAATDPWFHQQREISNILKSLFWPFTWYKCRLDFENIWKENICLTRIKSLILQVVCASLSFWIRFTPCLLWHMGPLSNLSFIYTLHSQLLDFVSILGYVSLGVYFLALYTYYLSNVRWTSSTKSKKQLIEQPFFFLSDIFAIIQIWANQIALSDFHC